LFYYLIGSFEDCADLRGILIAEDGKKNSGLGFGYCFVFVSSFLLPEYYIDCGYTFGAVFPSYFVSSFFIFTFSALSPKEDFISSAHIINVLMIDSVIIVA
jgi:hypothetical protein